MVCSLPFEVAVDIRNDGAGIGLEASRDLIHHN